MAYAELSGAIQINGRKFFRRMLPFDVSLEDKAIQEHRDRFNNTDIYRSIWDYETTDFETARICGPLFFDFDTADFNHSFLMDDIRSVLVNLHKILGLTYNDFQFFFSGHKGFHLIVPASVFGFSFEDNDKIIDFCKGIVAYLKEQFNYYRRNSSSLIDSRVYDRRRVFRIPNSLNSKSGLYKIQLTYEDLMSLRLDEIQDLAKDPVLFEDKEYPLNYEARQSFLLLMQESSKKEEDQEEKKKTVKKKSNRFLPCVIRLLQTSVSTGYRNNTAVALSNALLQMDTSVDEVYETMKEWNNNNDPPLPDDELLRTIMSANKMTKKDMFYGCSTMKDFGLCDPRKCPVR